MAQLNYNQFVSFDEDLFRSFIEMLSDRPSITTQGAADSFAALFVSTGYPQAMDFDKRRSADWSLGFVRGMEFAKIQARKDAQDQVPGCNN